MAQTQTSQSLETIQASLLNDGTFLQELVERTLQQILDREFSDFLGATPYERTATRRGHRNGSYTRTVITRVGPVSLQVPRDRNGEFSTTRFSRYQRSEKALMLSLVEMVLQGVSTGKVRRITEQLCGTSISPSTVSRLTTELDAELAIWRNRPLSRCPYLFVDARYEKVRHEGRVVSMAVLIAYGVTAEGYRKILDVSVRHSENTADYVQFFRGLQARGLTGVQLVISDDHPGLQEALVRSFPGSSWQRCQTHFLRNLLTRVRKRDRSWILGAMKDVYAAPSRGQAETRLRQLTAMLRPKYRDLADWLDEEAEETLTVYAFPAEHRRRLRTTNNIERLNQESKRRTHVVRIFPNAASCLRLITALCQEQSDEWESGKRYLIMIPQRDEQGAAKVG
jgi:transposase-like protein